MFRMYYTKSSLVGCYCPRVAAYSFKRQHPNPHPPVRDHSVVRARANATASTVRGSICLSILIWGGFGVGRLYIGAFVEHSPSQAAPWGRAIDDEWRYFLHYYPGRSPHGPLLPSHLPNGGNMKAWGWIADGNSNPNEWSYLWVMRKSISSMEKTIFGGGNDEKSPLYLGR